MIAENEISGHDRLFIYHNNYIVNLTNALEQLYPSILLLVGEEFFKKMSKKFIVEYPPNTGCLLSYGKDLIVFVKTISALNDYPYIADVMKIEWYIHELYYNFIGSSIEIRDLQKIDPDQYDDLHFTMNNNFVLIESDFNIYKIWQLAKNDTEQDFALNKKTYLLIYRKDYNCIVEEIDVKEYKWLSALMADKSLSEAVDYAEIADDQSLLTEYLLKYFRLEIFQSWYCQKN